METRLSILDIPSECLEEILLFLTPFEWNRCLQVCKSWNLQASSDSLWRSACRFLWTGKANHPNNELFHRALMDYSSLTEPEMKTLLMKRNYFGLERNYIQALIDSESQLEFLPPHYSCRLRGKWRASYVYSYLDSFRNEITTAELVNSSWTFLFKENPGEFSSQARFLSGGELIMQPFPMLRAERLTWTLLKSHRIIQICQFPPHHVSRMADDWSFRIENYFVIFFQSNFPAFSLAGSIRKVILEEGTEDSDDDVS